MNIQKQDYKERFLFQLNPSNKDSKVGLKKRKGKTAILSKIMRISLDKISLFTWERITEANGNVQVGLCNFDNDVNVVAVHFGISLQ